MENDFLGWFIQFFMIQVHKLVQVDVVDEQDDIDVVFIHIGFDGRLLEVTNINDRYVSEMLG